MQNLSSSYNNLAIYPSILIAANTVYLQPLFKYNIIPFTFQDTKKGVSNSLDFKKFETFPTHWFLRFETNPTLAIIRNFSIYINSKQMQLKCSKSFRLWIRNISALPH